MLLTSFISPTPDDCSGKGLLSKGHLKKLATLHYKHHSAEILIISNKPGWHLRCLNIYWPASRAWDQPPTFLSFLFFFPSCLLKVGVHKIFRGSSSEDDTAYTIPTVQVYCATETDILPPEKAKLVMGLNYCTRSTIRLTVWAWSHLGHWAEWKERSNTWNRAGRFCKVIQRNATFQDGKQKY